MKKFILLAIILVIQFTYLFPITLKVGLHTPDRRPFFWVDGQGKDKGIYIDFLKRLGEDLNIDIEFVYLPQARLIVYFSEGKIDIEPGIAPSWRPSKAAQDISLYTESFISLDDVLIFPHEKSIQNIFSMDDLVKLKGLKVGQVRGFYVPDYLEVDFIENELSIAFMVANKRIDAGFMNELVALYYKEEKILSYDISRPFASTEVSIRLHKNQKKWLNPMNQFILRIKKDGALQKIISKYIKNNNH
ncbi:MAG: transporter substrate-binding domain-containing protein [Spirochaetes bacterium]|nr:transporter substrate-binding domain-containing protein [Spirochaetota bacterium]